MPAAATAPRRARASSAERRASRAGPTSPRTAAPRAGRQAPRASVRWPVEIRQREIGSGKGLVEPGASSVRGRALRRWAGLRCGLPADGDGVAGLLRRAPERLDVGASSLPSSIRHAVVRAERPAASARGRSATSIVTLTIRWLPPRPKSSSFECCEMKPEPAFTMRVSAASIGLDGHARADRVAVALRPGQAHDDRAACAEPRSRCGRGGAAATSAAPSARTSASPSPS